MAENWGESSNPESADLTKLFETLSDWEAQLQAQNIDFEELGL